MKVMRLVLLIVLACAVFAGIAWSCHIEPPEVIVYGGDPNNIELSGTVMLSVGVKADVPIDKVELCIDGSVAATFTSEPYEYKWNTVAYTDGVHTLKAIAYGHSREVSSEDVIVKVNNSKAAATQ